MKRVFSWCVLLLGNTALRVLAGIVFLGTEFIFGLIGDLGSFATLIVILFGGGTIISGMVMPFFYGIPTIIAFSEALSPSNKGTRYSIIGWMDIALYSTNLIYAALGAVSGNLFKFCCTCVVVLIYGICLAFAGHGKWNEFAQRQERKPFNHEILMMVLAAAFVFLLTGITLGGRQQTRVEPVVEPEVVTGKATEPEVYEAPRKYFLFEDKGKTKNGDSYEVNEDGVLVVYTDSSTAIAVVAFESREHQMLTMFRETGDFYVYSDISEKVIYDFVNSDSIGGYFNKNIKGQYEYFKVEDDR